MRIQHNILAMNAYRNYNTNTSALAKNLEKLSSGYKINRAGDDAAGLAISEKMRAQITGLSAAQKNVKDGISLVKTAEGAMQEIQDMLNRMDYLATQSANGTYDDPVDRTNLNKEMEALKAEINRIADSANFNGIQLLDGSLTEKEAISSAPIVAEAEDILLIPDADNHYQLHNAGASSVSPSFQVDLKQACSGLTALGTINTAAGTFSLKVSVGNQTFTVSNLRLKSGSVASGDVIEAAKVDFSNARISGNASATLTNGIGQSLKFKATVANGVVSFSLASGETIKDFSVKMEVTISGSKVSLGSGAGANGNAGGNDSVPVSYNCKTQKQVDGVKATGTQLAHGHFEISGTMAQGLIDGGTLKIGTQVIEVDTESKITNPGASTGTVKIGISDLVKKDADGKVTFDEDKLGELARRITVGASENKAFTVGAASDGKTITLEEKYNFRTEGQEDTYIDTDDQFNELVNYKAKDGATDPVPAKDGRLVLQIGDTSDEFNKLRVKIGDMHVSAMGYDLDQATGEITTNGKSIKDIDIKSAEAAADAINVIKNAINYVSGVRGDLGAIQNRLEHTANNLSVMAENIQDAESTIRDTDIAEEMMSYTKNNILVQSAQAMLAQANAVPQGVLQLLG